MSIDVQRIDKYELLEQLGLGGMATVWKALDTQLERYVAIKFLHADRQNDPDFLKRFAREARAVASLRHSNIVRVYDFQAMEAYEGVINRTPTAYMVMDYIEGPTLADYIRTTSRQGNFPPAQDILSLFTALSDAIDYAHSRGMIHRDIKPANILLDQRNRERKDENARSGGMGEDARGAINRAPTLGEPILTDFGIVKLLGASTATLSGAWLGTPIYISPEQAQGYSGNEQSDIYSLGVILYEICTGVRPFTGDSPVSIIMQHISAPPTPPALINPRISPALSDVILCSLAKNPSDRFPSASALVAALVPALSASRPVALDPLDRMGENGAGQPRHYSTGGSDGFLVGGMDDFQTRRFPSYPSFSGLNALAANRGPSASPDTVPPAVVASTPTTPTGREAVVGAASQGAPVSSAVPFAQDILNRGYPVTPLPSSIARERPPALQAVKSRGRMWLRLGLIALVVVVLTGGALGALYLQPRQAAPLVPNPVVGHAVFGNSWQLVENSSQGTSDEMHISLSPIASLARGKHYYAWLLSDTNVSPTMALLLGPLSFRSENASLQYMGDKAHTNLLGSYSRLLITEEQSLPKALPSDQHEWRYYAEFPQTATEPGQQTILDYLRAFLYNNDILQAPDVHGSLGLQLYERTQQVAEWASSARESWHQGDMHAARDQVIRILDYLDGANHVNPDVPTGTPLLIDANYIQIPLIVQAPNQLLSSYVDLVDNQLQNMINTPGITPEMHEISVGIDADLSNNVQLWFEQVRKDAKQLLQMTNTQLLQPSALNLLNELVVQAENAFAGRTDPASGNEQNGVRQVYAHLQSLATFDIRPYLSK